MKHERKKFNKHYDEGERRRGKRYFEETDEEHEEIVPKVTKEKQKERKEVAKEANKKEQLVSIKKPQSLRPPARKEFKAPEKRSADEIRLIKEEFSRRFKESLRERKNTENVD